MLHRISFGRPNVSAMDSPRSPGGMSSADAHRVEDQILLQCFNWECWDRTLSGMSWWDMLKFKAESIANAGVTTCWLPPPSLSVDSQGYLPLEPETLNSKYGTIEELRNCISALHARHLWVLADLVLNHRCAQVKGPDGKYNVYTGKYAWDHRHICSEPAQFGGTAQPKDEKFTTYEAAPNIDHSSDLVRQDIKSWLTELREGMRFDGWRFDFARGYDPQYVKEYIEDSRPTFAVGEYWDDCAYIPNTPRLEPNQDPHRQRIMDWIDATGAAAFDFTTKALLQEAVLTRNYDLLSKDGQQPGVMGWWSAKSVTFIENHDTGSTQERWPFPKQHLQQGYAYILTHPGIPCIFWDHIFSEGRKPSMWRNLRSALLNRIRKRSWVLRPLNEVIIFLIRLRRAAQVRSDSQVVIHVAKKNCYAATVNGRLTVKLGARLDPGCRLRATGAMVCGNERLQLHSLAEVRHSSAGGCARKTPKD